MTTLHGCKFWGVDNVKPAANFCIWPLAQYLETNSAFWGLTEGRRHAMRTSILSPGSMCQSVRFGSLTLSNDQETVFWGEIEFSKFQKLELSLSCSSFLRQLKIRENKIRRTELQSRESSQKLAAGSCYSQFPDIKLNEKELFYSWVKSE